MKHAKGGWGMYKKLVGQSKGGWGRQHMGGERNMRMGGGVKHIGKQQAGRTKGGRGVAGRYNRWMERVKDGSYRS